jgi:hypothetical protein
MPKMKVKETHRNDELGQNEATLTMTNDALLFIRAAVNAYIESGLGDIDDPKFNEIKKEVQEDIHQAWRLLNPS